MGDLDHEKDETSNEEVTQKETKIKSLLHQQEILEKNFKNQLREETKRRKTIVKELREAERKIDDLGKIINEKDKLINRLNIYSRGRTLPQLKHSEFSTSTPNNLNLFDDESVITKLDKKLKDFGKFYTISSIKKQLL